MKDQVFCCPTLKNLSSKSAILDLFSEMMLSLMTLLIGIYWKLSLILEQNGIFLNNSQNTVTKRNYFIDRCQVFSNSSHQNYVRFSSGLFGFQHLTRLYELDLNAKNLMSRFKSRFLGFLNLAHESLQKSFKMIQNSNRFPANWTPEIHFLSFAWTFA